MKAGEAAGLHPRWKSMNQLSLCGNDPVSPLPPLLLPVHLACTVCRELSLSLDKKAFNIRTVCRTDR